MDTSTESTCSALEVDNAAAVLTALGISALNKITAINKLRTPALVPDVSTAISFRALSANIGSSRILSATGNAPLVVFIVWLVVTTRKITRRDSSTYSAFRVTLANRL